MEEEVEMTFDEALEYVKTQVEVGDLLEISYNRICSWRGFRIHRRR